MSDTLSDDEIKALIEKYQECSDRGHPAPCICSSVEQKHWHHFAKELLAARETIARLTNRDGRTCSDLQRECNEHALGIAQVNSKYQCQTCGKFFYERARAVNHARKCRTQRSALEGK